MTHIPEEVIDELESDYTETNSGQKESWTIIKCKGVNGGGCGRKFNMVFAKVIDGCFICPNCGARN